MTGKRPLHMGLRAIDRLSISQALSTPSPSTATSLRAPSVQAPPWCGGEEAG